MNKKKQSPQTLRGFSTVELIITTTILTIVTAFGLFGISRAKASIRLSGSAREFASYIEKARLYSIRRHADNANERANVAINDDKTSYNVAMDLDGDGDLDTRTINLPSGVKFDTIETIAFDWRGRTWNTVGGNTESNAQVSITLKYGSDAVSIDVTGSGDITIDSKVFDDKVPQVELKVGDLAAGATPVPTPDTTTPASTPDPTGTVPADGTNPTATPTPTPGGGTTSTPTPTPTPTATPTPKPTPTPRATPTPTPTPEVCTITTSPSSLSLSLLGTGTIKVSTTSTSSVSITATSSKSSDLQVTPNQAQTVSAGGSATFTLKSKKAIGIYSVTFSAPCGTKTVPVIVIL